jgi:serine/threonine protein kinase/WD40 repeat protein
MALAAGTRLGPYEILDPLGAGGMGEVYRARDTRLDRTVAVKVLAAKVSGDPRLRERLEREARAVSRLNHPHVCVLHDVGREGKTDFIVMEHLVGETLAERLRRGPLRPDEALRHADEIARALDAAHRQGIVHRDLKPGNVMLTKAGAKLMDFGLSRARRPGDAPWDSALQTEAMTEEGTILGTLPYMAPEQLEGRETDSRTDLFSFGATLYEMVTGRRAFRGDTRASVIAAIMSSEPPPVSELQPLTPLPLDRVVKRCLAKDPEDRWQSAGDLAAELEWIRESLANGAEAPARALPRWRRSRFPWGASLVAAASLAAALTALYLDRARHHDRTGGSTAVYRSEVSLPDHVRLKHAARHGIALSPDGRWLAYLGGAQEGDWEENQIYVRPLDQWDSRPLPNTQRVRNIAFSPDSEWLAFAQGEQEGSWAIKRVSIESGQILTVCDGLPSYYFSKGTGISWGDDDWIVFDGNDPGLKRVPASGGEPESLDIELPDEPSETRMQLPVVLPGSGSILFTAVRYQGLLEPRFTDIYAWSADTGEARKLVEGAIDAQYVPTGHLLFAREGSLYAAPFDADRLRVTGPEVRVLSGVAHSIYVGWRYLETGAAQFSVSKKGALAYAPGSVAPERRRTLVWVDRQGREEIVDHQQGIGPFPSVRISPDQRYLLLGWGRPPHGVRLYDLRRRTMRRLTFEGRSMYPIWGPGADSFTFDSDAEGPTRIYIGSLSSGPESVERMPTGDERGWHMPASWSPDGGALMFSLEKSEHVSIWTTSQGHTSRLSDPAFQENLPEFSPDGRWIAYTSSESGSPEVYVRPYGHPGRTHKVSTQGGHAPAWTRGGTEIVFRRHPEWYADGRPGFYAVTFRASRGEVQLGEPTFLFEDKYRFSSPSRLYDVAPDGERFILVKEDLTEAETQEQLDRLYPTRIHVVQNWFEELKSIPNRGGP